MNSLTGASLLALAKSIYYLNSHFLAVHVHVLPCVRIEQNK